jgi:hypothetical protein
MRTTLFSTLLFLAAAACSRDTARDGANTARDNQSGPVDLSRSGQPVAPAGTYNTGDSSERPSNQPGTADTGASAQSTGYTTSGPMGTGGGGYTTGTTSAAGNQGVPTTQQNPDVTSQRTATRGTAASSSDFGATAQDTQNQNQDTGAQAVNGANTGTATGDQLQSAQNTDSDTANQGSTTAQNTNRNTTTAKKRRSTTSTGTQQQPGTNDQGIRTDDQGTQTSRR